MLRHLSLKDFVIVPTLELDFEPGFAVLTGETGAGKSILIDALQLALGGRGEAGVVREGAVRAGANPVGAHTAAHQGAHRVDEDRLAGAGLTGEHGETRCQFELDGIDDHEIANGKSAQHGRSTGFGQLF